MPRHEPSDLPDLRLRGFMAMITRSLALTLKATCVSGGTGCWCFKTPERVQRYVLDFKPDLLIIGGISHRDDIDSVKGLCRGNDRSSVSVGRRAPLSKASHQAGWLDGNHRQPSFSEPMSRSSELLRAIDRKDCLSQSGG
jgi:hypothetical protein